MSVTNCPLYSVAAIIAGNDPQNRIACEGPTCRLWNQQKENGDCSISWIAENLRGIGEVLVTRKLRRD